MLDWQQWRHSSVSVFLSRFGIFMLLALGILAAGTDAIFAKQEGVEGARTIMALWGFPTAIMLVFLLMFVWSPRAIRSKLDSYCFQLSQAYTASTRVNVHVSAHFAYRTSSPGHNTWSWAPEGTENLPFSMGTLFGWFWFDVAVAAADVELHQES